MKTNLALYSYDNFKPDFTDTRLEDMVKKMPFDLPNAFEGYVLPKEFAARLSDKLGYSEIVFPFRDVPLTNRNMLESHIFTKCTLLPFPTETFNSLLPIYNSIQTWGEGSEQPTRYSNFTRYLTSDFLTMLHDRVRFVPSHPYVDLSPDPKAVLKACGVTYKELFKNIIAFIESTENFKYSRNVINFIKTYIEVDITARHFTFRSKLQHLRCVSGFGPHVKDPVRIARFLYAVYFSQYKQWVNGSSWVDINGDKIYVDHHTVYEIGKYTEYLQNNVDYKNQLPFGIHPSKYFKERIEYLAQQTYTEAKKVTYPKGFNGYVDLSNSPHRQLLTGLDLVNEGVFMKHCVGGENYREQMSDGNTLFFHLQVPGDKFGSTLSMHSSGPCNGSYRLNGKWWSVGQYYGYDDVPGHRGESEVVLQEFLSANFTKYNRNLITKINGQYTRSPIDFVYCRDWVAKAIQYVAVLNAATWKNIIGQTDHSLTAACRAPSDPAHTTTDRHQFMADYDAIGTWANGFRPELAEYSSSTPQRVDESFYSILRAQERQVQVQPRAEHITVPMNWHGNCYNGNNRHYRLLVGHHMANEPDTSDFEMTARRTINGEHPKSLRPIKLCDGENRKFYLTVDGVTVTRASTSAQAVVPPNSVVRMFPASGSGKVKAFITSVKSSDSKTEVLSESTVYVNTTDQTQMFSAYVISEVRPSTLPSLINDLLYHIPPTRETHVSFNRSRPTSR